MLVITSTRILMTIAAIVLAYRLSAEDNARIPRRDPWSRYLLRNLVLLSIVLYLGMFMYPKPWVVVHEHDIFHYYMGAKYSTEVGYSNLYESVTVAEEENLGRDPHYMVRRMDDYKFRWSREVLENRDEYRSRFTPDRWEEFKGDVAVFRESLDGGGRRWATAVGDKGYNATPAWTAIAKPITHVVSVQWPPGMLVLACIDTALLILAFVAVGRTFDTRTALMAVVVLGTLVAMADGTIRGAFLRLDWLVALVLATCALRRNRYKTAGALVAYSTMVRIFPAVFLFGLGAKAIWDLVVRRRLNRRHVEFFLTFLLVILALFTLSVTAGGSLEDWENFWAKIRFHDGHLTLLRVGFKTVVLAAATPFMERWTLTPMVHSGRIHEVQGLLWALQAIALIGAFVVVRRLEDHETIPFGWVPLFVLAAPTHYYQVTLLVLSLLFLPKLIERERAHGLALLLGTSLVTYFLWAFQNLSNGVPEGNWKRFSYPVTVAFSSLLFVVALYALWVAYRGGVSPPARPSSAGAAEPDS